MIIGSLDLDQRRILIAEIGNNHEGDGALALELVDAAADSGADAVKIQVINPERLVNKDQTERIAQLSRLRLSLSQIQSLAERANSRGLLFLASAFDVESLEKIAPLISAVKIASGDLDFEPLLQAAASVGKPIILSTGMADMAEVRTAVETIRASLPISGTPQEFLALLHCVSLYPTPLRFASIRSISTLYEEFGLTVGYSDHCLGTEACVLALQMGARIIEKHFTFDKTRTTYRDHSLSADPEEMKRLAEVVRHFDEILGPGGKTPAEAEREASFVARRSIVAARDMAANETLSLSDLEYVRPRSGLAPADAKLLVGKKLRAPVKTHEVLLESHVLP